MKLRQKFKFTASVMAVAFGVGTKGYTQNISQAVMDVRVEIVSGAQHIDRTITNISDQVQQGSERFSFGQFELSIPESTAFMISHNPIIKMNDDYSEWHINADLKEETSAGKTTLHLSGRSSTDIPSGNFAGQHVTEIIYL